MTHRAQSPSTASVSRLWEVVSDVTRWPDHLATFDEVREVTATGGDAGDAGVVGDAGRRFAVRQPGLPAARYEVTAWTAGSAFTWVARSAGVTTTATHSVAAQGAGSQLVLTVDWRGPLAPFVRLLAGRKTQRFIDIEARTLAEVAESNG